MRLGQLLNYSEARLSVALPNIRMCGCDYLSFFLLIILINSTLIINCINYFYHKYFFPVS